MPESDSKKRRIFSKCHTLLPLWQISALTNLTRTLNIFWQRFPKVFSDESFESGLAELLPNFMHITTPTSPTRFSIASTTNDIYIFIYYTIRDTSSFLVLTARSSKVHWKRYCYSITPMLAIRGPRASHPSLRNIYAYILKIY